MHGVAHPAAVLSSKASPATAPTFTIARAPTSTPPRPHAGTHSTRPCSGLCRPRADQPPADRESAYQRTPPSAGSHSRMWPITLPSKWRLLLLLALLVGACTRASEIARQPAAGESNA